MGNRQVDFDPLCLTGTVGHFFLDPICSLKMDAKASIHQKNCESCFSVPVSLSGRRREKARDGGRQEDKQKGRKDRETGRQKGKNKERRTIENELKLTKQKIETQKDSSEK